MFDLRYAMRTFARSPGFALAVVAVFALGIAGTTSIFSLVDGVLIRPLPFVDADRVVALRVDRPLAGSEPFSPGDFLDLVAEQTSFNAVGAYRTSPLDLVDGRGNPARLDGAFVTPAFFEVFGTRPALGRLPSSAGDPRRRAAQLVLGDSAWRQHFGGDPGVVDRVVRVNGTPHVVAAVMPPGFRWPLNARAWALSPSPVPPSPLEVPDLLTQRELRYFEAIARLENGRTVPQAATDLERVMRSIEQRHPISEGRRVTPVLLQQDLVGDVRAGLLLLLGAVSCVLVIACINVAGLLVARGLARRREVSTRAALGASRGRIVRQLVTECLALSVLGGVCGFVLAAWATPALVALAPDTIPRVDEVRIDTRAAAIAFLLACVTGVLAGLLPALRASNVGHGVLSRGGQRTSARVRMFLVTGQIALALVLLATAGLLITSFVRLRGVEHGLDVDQVVSATLTLPAAAYDSADRRTRFYTELLDRLQSAPETRDAALVQPAPFLPSRSQLAFELEQVDPLPDRDRPVAQLTITSPGAFRVLGVPLLGGRDFTPADTADAPPVVIVNAAFARRHWPGLDPVGRRVTFDRRGAVDLPTWHTVVGVVADTRPRALDAAPQPTIYFPYPLLNFPFTAVVIRGRDAGAIASAFGGHLRALDPALPAPPVQPLARAMNGSIAQPRLRTYILAAFAAVALLLAIVGLYGLVSHGVSERRSELALRQALGATSGQVVRLVVGDGARAGVLGGLLGLAGALGIGQLIRSLLYEVGTFDPVTYAGAALVLAVAVLLACCVPARRAARVDPISALRSE
jgi:predicted permease